MQNTPKIAVACHFFYLMPDMREELLAKYPDARFSPDKSRFTREEFIDLVKGCDTALVSIHPRLDESVLKELPELKVISTCSAGLDHIDPEAFNKFGVHVGWERGVNRDSVSELALCHILSLLRDIYANTIMLKNGEWPPRVATRLLRDRTVGIHGCGEIGKALVKLLQPFGCKEILACDTQDYSDFYKEYGVRAVSPEELWAESEILSIHLSKNSTTRGLYTAAVQDKLRPGILLVNTARGGLFDEAALAERLKDGRIGGAAFDVFEDEPAPDPALLGLPNMLCTPHIAGSAREAWVAMCRAGIKGVEDNWLPQPGVYPFD